MMIVTSTTTTTAIVSSTIATITTILIIEWIDCQIFDSNWASDVTECRYVVRRANILQQLREIATIDWIL